MWHPQWNIDGYISVCALGIDPNDWTPQLQIHKLLQIFVSRLSEPSDHVHNLEAGRQYKDNREEFDL